MTSQQNLRNFFVMNNQTEHLDPDSKDVKEKIKQDLAHLYNYPSIGKLFSDADLNNLEKLRTKLNATRERLDTIVRRGSDEESQKASKALAAISLTLQFLDNLEQEKIEN